MKMKITAKRMLKINEIVSDESDTILVAHPKQMRGGLLCSNDPAQLAFNIRERAQRRTAEQPSLEVEMQRATNAASTRLSAFATARPPSRPSTLE